METIQKLELSAGVMTFVIQLIFFFAAIFFRKSDYAESSLVANLIGGLLFLGVPALIAIGSYLDVVRRSHVGFLILCSFGGLFIFANIFFFFYGFLIGSVIKFSNLIALLPVLFALVTVISALRSKNKYSL